MLRGQMTVATYSAVIEPMRLVHWHDGRVIVETTQLSREWAESRLSDVILRGFSAVEEVDEIIYKT